MAEDANNSSHNRWPWYVRAILGVAVSAAALLILYFGWVFSRFTTPYTGRQPIPFEHEAWLADTDERQGARYLMLDDLFAKHPLVGLSRNDLEALLGPIKRRNPSTGWSYYLGPEPSPFGVDDAWLLVEFDSSDRVVSTRVATD
jgi:hypothetical protein